MQRAVQRVGEALRIVGRRVEFDDPLVRSFASSVHVDGAGRVVADARAGRVAGGLERRFGVIDDDLLAEGVDIVARAPGDPDLVRSERRELDRVADLVAPQAVAGRDDHRVVDLLGDPLERHCPGRIVQIAHRQELVVHAVVEHQQQVVRCRIVLYGEEALRCVVGFHVFHPVGRNELPVLLPVGLEVHAAVREQLQTGPHFEQVAFARKFEHLAQHDQIPRRNPGESRYVLSDRLAANRLDFLLEIGNQCRLGLRNAHPAGQPGRVFDQNGRQVAFLSAASGRFETPAASERQRFAREYVRVGP